MVVKFSLASSAKPAEGGPTTRVENSGVIEAAQAELKAAGGSFYDLAVNQSGIIRATGVETKNGRVILRHTEVPFEYSGQGYGTRLARAVFDKLRAEGARVIARCPFMALFAARNPEYAAMLDG